MCVCVCVCVCSCLRESQEGFCRRKGSRLRGAQMKTTGRGEEEEGWIGRKGGREREEDTEKWDALLEAPCHEILIIYLHGYQEPSHCLYILLSHPSFLLHFASPVKSQTFPLHFRQFLICSFFFTLSSLFCNSSACCFYFPLPSFLLSSSLDGPL